MAKKKPIKATKSVKKTAKTNKPAKKSVPARKGKRNLEVAVTKIAKTRPTAEKKSVKKIAGKKPLVKPAKKPAKLVKKAVPAKPAKKGEAVRTAVRKTVRAVKKVRSAKPSVPETKTINKAPKSTIKKTPVVKMYDESEVLDVIKNIFPEIKKRVIENVQLTDKQIKRLTQKFPKKMAKIPANIKRSLGIVDDSTKALDAAELAAKTRVVDTEKADENAKLMQLFENAKQEQGEAQTSKIIKAVQLRVNKRLFGLYTNYKKIVTQLNNFTSVALNRVAQQYIGTQTGSMLEKAIPSVSSIFTSTEENEYDFFSYGGSKLDDLKTGLDDEGDFVDEDAREGIANKPLIADPNQATAADTAPEYDDNDSAFTQDSESEPESVSDSGSGKKKITRKKENYIRTTGQTRIRYADKASMVSKVIGATDMFNGSKRAACLGFTMGAIDKHGSFSTASMVYDENNNAQKVTDPNVVVHGNTTLPFHTDKLLFAKFADVLGQAIGMKQVSLGLKTVLSTKAYNFLRINGFNDTYHVLMRKNSDNTGRYGIIISASKGSSDNDCRVLVIHFGILGITHQEITTLCQGDFKDMNDKLFEYVAYSILSNGLMSQGKVFGFSLKEKSLLAPSRQNATEKKNKIFKLANGHIHFLPDIDRRHEFATFQETLKLPETLDDTLLGPDGKTDAERFSGAVVYTDLVNNIAFHYSKAGKLCSTIFSGACDLNARDCANLMKPTPMVLGMKAEQYDPTNENHRADMSPYGTETYLPIRYIGRSNINLLDTTQCHGFPGFSQNTYILVRIEDLRDSWNSDQRYYNVIAEALENYLSATSTKLDADDYSGSGNAHSIVAQNGGLTDIDWQSAKYMETKRMMPRDASAIAIMLEIAKKSKEEWPGLDTWQKRAEDARVKPPSKSDLQDIVGQFDGLIQDDNGEFPTFMPHQAYTLHTLGHQDTAALDCDMGGGKTFMSCCDATRWIKTGVHGKPARPCIVMPASLIENYMTDVKNNFFGKNLNFFVLSSETRRWSGMDNKKIIELAKGTPVNTVFVASYEWLGLDNYPVVVGTTLKPFTVKKSGDGKKGKREKLLAEVPQVMDVYPNAQLLLDIGINVLYLDESQKIKNPSSGTHKSVQTLSGIPVKRIMTGTMVTRDVDDVFTQTSFIDGTMIGTRSRFAHLYCVPGKESEIRRGLEKKVRQTLTASGVMQLRRSMWLGLLPKKTEKFEFVKLEGLHGAVYEVLMQDILQDDKELKDTASYYNDPALIEQAKTYTLTLLTGSNSDIDEDPHGEDLERMRAEACGDDVNDDNEEKAGRGKTNKLAQFFEKKRSIATKVSMLQAFISNPQALKPENFGKEAQEKLKNLNSELPDHTAKDLRIVELIEDHWKTTSGKYIKRSEQKKLYGDDTAKMRGKVIIFALNISTVEHVYAYLKKSKFANRVVKYVKSDSKANDNLLDFKNAENDDAAIIVAAETSVIYGQNMQAADMMIKLTLPWTTGDYDQAVARIYRNGQKLECSIYNIIANGTFEVGKLAKFLIRQNSNRKLISDYTNPYNMNHALGSIGKGGLANILKDEADMRNFTYEDDITHETVHLDLLDVHQSVYDHEIQEAKKHIKTFEEAGYGDPNTQRIAMASGESVIDAVSEDLRPKDPSGKPLTPGEFQLADLTYFDGDVIVNSRNINKKSLTAEIKRQRDLELAQSMGEDVVNALVSQGADVLLRQYMIRALNEALQENPAFKKFIPESGTKGFTVYLGQALRSADMRLLNVEGMSFKNFAEVAGNDLSDPETRAELMTLARICYNKVVKYYPGCTAIDESVEVKYNKAQQPIDVIGYDKHMDHGMVKKNAKIISAIVGKAKEEEEETPTQKNLKDIKQRAARRAEVEEQEPVEDAVNGINLGVSELVVVDEDEDLSSKNVPINDSVYVFAPAGANDPKLLKKLLKVNLGVGRGTKKFEKKVMWLYNRPVSDMKQVVSIAIAIENAGGFVQKVGKGAGAKYAITTDEAALAVFRVKAPTNFGKLEDMGGLAHHVATAAKLATTKLQAEVELGLFMFDRRILVMGESRNEVLLKQVGFKRIELYRADFDRNSKLQSNLETCFKRIRSAGLEINNSDLLARRLKLLAGKAVAV